MPNYPGTQNTDDNLYVGVNNLSTVLTDNPLTAGAVTVNVSDASLFPTVGILTIDLEAIHYTGTTATSFTGCTRGFDGTTAASHPLNTTVFHDIPAAHHNVLKDEVKAVSDDLRDGFTGDLDDSVAPAATATDNKQRLDHIVTQLKAVTGEADWKTVPTNTISALETQQNTNETNITTLEGNVQDYSLPSFKRLRGVSTGPINAIMDAQEVVLEDPSKNKIRFTNVTETVTITTNGVGGLDTGSEAADTWYYIWLISNGSVIDGLFSVSSTSPTMPSGYTFKVLVSAIRNDGSSNFIRFNQRDKFYYYSKSRVIVTNTTSFNVNVSNVSASTFIPVISQFGIFSFSLVVQYSVAGMRGLVGEMMQSGQGPALGDLAAILFNNQWYQDASIPVQMTAMATVATNTEQKIDYYMFRTSANVTSSSGSIRVCGFILDI